MEVVTAKGKVYQVILKGDTYTGPRLTEIGIECMKVRLEPVMSHFTLDHLHQMDYTGPFPENEKEAWDITLAKWFLINEWGGVRADGGYHTCGLCLLHRDYFSCGNCPLALRGYSHCAGTPYGRNDRAELSFLLSIFEEESGVG